MADMYDEIKVGQVWRRKSGGALVTVMEVKRFGRHDVDVKWSREEPRRTGWCLGSNFLGLYEISTPPAGGESDG